MSKPNFVKTESYQPKNNKEKQLIEAFLKLKTKDEVAAFLRDLLTIQEIEEFSNRLEIARLLATTKFSYKKIAQMTKVSTTTVTRVAHWLFRGCGGYQKVLKK
jgi:TrpR-related protein YerC/YecD